ncbi:hypothetical protein [Alteraurantiacibacter aestuarii]|uniref:hypothetical protein n=1 Tax=Alteraurantiacibacter aestuarii TaxID=650004 RepID=UPI0031DD8401
MSRPAHRKTVKSFASAFAMTIALAGGALVTNAGIAPAAYAQDYSDEFVDAYQPVADVVNAEGGDAASVTGQLPGIVALAMNADEKFAAGNLILSAGNKTNTPALQRQGLELQLESGMVDPANVGQYYWFVGNLAFQMEDYNDARTALESAVANGWTESDPVALLAETYYEQDDVTGGVAYMLGQAERVLASGGTVPEQWLLRGLQTAYGEDLLDQSTDISVLLVTNHTSPRNWMNALQVINALHELDDQAQLDLFRLMRLTGSLTERSEFIRYIEAADPRIMSNEVVDVLAAGLAAGEFEAAGDTYYTEVKSIVEARMADDANEAPELVADARSEAGGEAALIAGDVLYSLDDFAGAEEMYAMAVTKGGIDANTALTRMGIAQVQQGKIAEAQATFGQVSGPRSTVAKMWSAYAMTQAS